MTTLEAEKTTPKGRTRRTAGALVLLFWGLLAANTWITASRTGIVTGSDVSTVLLLLAAALAIAFGLAHHSPWAWWGAVVLAGGALFFVLPVAASLLLGTPQREPVATVWDIVFFPVTAGVLIALLVLLLRLRRVTAR